MKRAQERPLVERWNWVQFTCAFVFAAFVAFLNVDPLFDGLTWHLVKTFVVASAFGALAGRFGDWAWAGLARLLWFW